ncbi:MAG: hypothetical protein QOG72_3279 [Sphingomonadales bacterium]|jgi:hypothetical protein|nr:hypothetical protein [Sphingomonadales bacterium]
MRDLLSKVMTGSIVAAGALLVVACGGGEDAAANNVSANYTDDALMGGNTGDVTAVDALNGTDANLGATTDLNTTGSTTTANTTTTETTTTNTGTGNTTGM